MTNGKDAAFARPTSIDETDGTLSDGNRQVAEAQGLTKHEYFAAMAMQGLIANGNLHAYNCAAESVEFANALIEALNAKPEHATKTAEAL